MPQRKEPCKKFETSGRECQFIAWGWISRAVMLRGFFLSFRPLLTSVRLILCITVLLATASGSEDDVKLQASGSSDDSKSHPVKFIVISKQHSGTSYLERQLRAYVGIECGTEIFLGKNRFCRTAAGKIPIEKMEMAWGTRAWVNMPNAEYKSLDGERRTTSPSDVRSQISCLKTYKFTEKYTGKKLELSDADWNLVMRDKNYIQNFREYLGGLSAIGFGIQLGQIRFDSEIFRYFHDNDVRILFLKRTNYLAHVLASSALRTHDEEHSPRHVTEGELAHASAYLHELKEYEGMASQSCTRSLRVYYETYTTNFSSFIGIYRFLGISTPFSIDEYRNGTVALSYIDPRSGNRRVDSVVFDTDTKHHTDLTAHYISNKEDVRNFISKHSPEDMCMMSNDCPRKENTILPLSPTCSSHR